jgi:hypothetical protein
MMKKSFSLLAMMAVLMPLFISNVIASSSDSCLKMALPNDYCQEWNAEMNSYEWVGSVNEDSVKIDSCFDSPTFGKEFCKRNFVLKFPMYPFETLLNDDDTVAVKNVPDKIIGLRAELEKLQKQFGDFYFTKKYSLSNLTDYYLWDYGIVSIIFDEYQPIDSVLNEFKNQISSLEKIIFHAQVMTPAGGGNVKSSSRKELQVYPNPTDQLLTLQIDYVIGFQNIEIYNSNGIKVKEILYSKTINISDLPKGVYFIKYANENLNFVKQ